MKYLLLALLVLIPGVASADDKSHLAAAQDLIDLMGGKQVMRDAFITSINAMGAGNPQISAAEADDMKKATLDWFDTDFKWEDLRGQFADIYLRAFSEDELNQILAFYKTPVGKKALATLPEVMKESMAIGQQYAQSKQTLLMVRLQKVHAQYHPTAPAPGSMAPAAASAPAVPSSPAATTSLPAAPVK